ncbi:MAG TPA: hypothetical protein VHQ24_15445 [Lachnospiraceae bacterium]|nr:hypothetical protein [Lachnospiraceae bacterium]
MFCRYCGKEVHEKHNFCTRCGHTLDHDSKASNPYTYKNYIQDMQRFHKPHDTNRKLSYSTIIAIIFSTMMLCILCFGIFLVKWDPKFSRSFGESTGVDSYSSESSINKRAPLGSAGYLSGKSLLISIYVRTDDKEWTPSEMTYSKESIDEAARWIEKQGEAYGQKVELIYDIDANSDLMYYQDISFRIDSDSDNNNTELYYIYNLDWIEKNIPTQELKEKYNVDSIGYIFFVNDWGTSYAYPHYVENGTDYYEEMCTLFLHDSSLPSEYETPATYAHEILHLFGAIDLYEDACPDEITEYVEETYPLEIMYDTYVEGLLDDISSGSKVVSPITAYMIGWEDNIDELSTFPDLIREYEACFSENDVDAKVDEDDSISDSYEDEESEAGDSDNESYSDDEDYGSQNLNDAYEDEASD